MPYLRIDGMIPGQMMMIVPYAKALELADLVMTLPKGTTQNFGKMERRFLFGCYLSDHTMLKPGALAQANGGFLLLSVIVVLSAGWIAYAVLPIYGAMKTIDPDILEGAQDLGAGWITTWRKILLPLTATGFLATIIIVFVPILSDFAAPALVGGTKGMMLSSVIEEEYLQRGDWGVGSALTFALLLASAGIVWLSYRISHVKRLQTTRD